MNPSSKVIDCVLPITLDDGIKLSPKDAREIGEELAGAYCFAEPYPHIVIDNFLPKNFLVLMQRLDSDQVTFHL